MEADTRRRNRRKIVPHKYITFVYLDSTINSRRGFFTKAAGVVAGSIGFAQASNAYTLPDLPYAFEALEPYIDTPTMKIHHDKHHGKANG